MKKLFKIFTVSLFLGGIILIYFTENIYLMLLGTVMFFCGIIPFLKMMNKYPEL